MAEKLARVRDLRPIAPDVVELHAECVDPPAWSYRPGQFLSLRIGEGGNLRRSYSLASHPSEGSRFELLVKLLPVGVGSDYVRQLQRRDELHFTGPMGFFVPDLAHDGDVVFVVTGAGIAPVPAMAKEILSRPGEKGRVIVWWGMRHPEDVYWRDRFDALAASSPRFSWTLSLSRPPPGWTGAVGHVTAHVVAEAPALDKPVFYVVGNGDMIREVKAALEALGVNRKKQIRTEVFYPATTSVARPAT